MKNKLKNNLINWTSVKIVIKKNCVRTKQLSSILRAYEKQLRLFQLLVSLKKYKFCFKWEKKLIKIVRNIVRKSLILG